MLQSAQGIKLKNNPNDNRSSLVLVDLNEFISPCFTNTRNTLCAVQMRVNTNGHWVWLTIRVNGSHYWSLQHPIPVGVRVIRGRSQWNSDVAINLRFRLFRLLGTIWVEPTSTKVAIIYSKWRRWHIHSVVSGGPVVGGLTADFERTMARVR